MRKHVVVIGGGVAGLEAAGQLSKAGIEVSLVEKESRTGGHLNKWYKLFPDRRKSVEVMDYLDGITVNHGINILTGTTIEKFDKNRNSYSITTNKGKELVADAVIVATGFDLFKSARKEEYGYGIYDNVITSADMEDMFRRDEIILTDGYAPEVIGIIHCVG